MMNLSSIGNQMNGHRVISKTSPPQFMAQKKTCNSELMKSVNSVRLLFSSADLVLSPVSCAKGLVGVFPYPWQHLVFAFFFFLIFANLMGISNDSLHFIVY